MTGHGVGIFWMEQWGFPAISSRSGKGTEIVQKKTKKKHDPSQQWPCIWRIFNQLWMKRISEKERFSTSYFCNQLSVFYWWPIILQLIWSCSNVADQNIRKENFNFKFWECTSRWAIMTVSGCEGNIQQTPKIWFWQEKEGWFRRTSCTHGDRWKVSTSLTHHNYSIWSKFTSASH